MKLRLSAGLGGGLVKPGDQGVGLSRGSGGGVAVGVAGGEATWIVEARQGLRVRACQLMCGVSEEVLARASGWKLVGRVLPGSRLALGPDSPFPQTPTELESQTDRCSANASIPSGEQLRRVLAEVERLLQEMRARDLGFHQQRRPSWGRPSDVSGVLPAGQSGKGPGAEASPDWRAPSAW